MRLVLCLLALACVAGDSYAGCKLGGKLRQRFSDRRVAPIRNTVQAVREVAKPATKTVVCNGQTCVKSK